MPFSESTPESPQEASAPEEGGVAEKVRSGEFFRESRMVFHQLYSDPLSERYLYMTLSGMALLILLVTLLAIDSFLPLSQQVPFIYKINDIVEDMPRMKRLGAREDDTNMLLKRFLVSNYVYLREDYDVILLERNAVGVRAQSTPEVFEEYQRIMDPANSQSPISLYQRHSVRRTEILSVAPTQGGDGYEMDVVYNAVVETGSERKKTRMIANIAFTFKDITVDQEKEGLPPIEFRVTRYQTRRLQDS